MEDERDPGASGFLALERRGVEPQKSRTGIMDLEFMAHHTLAAIGVEPRDLLPFQVREQIGNRSAFGIGLQAEEAGDRLVKIENVPGFVDNQHPVLDGVEEGFEETALARQALNDLRQPVLVEERDPSDDLVEETGFACHRCWPGSRGPPAFG